MTLTQLPLSLAQRHNNQHLFSDHFLKVTLPTNPEWQFLAHDAGIAQAPSQIEAQTEDELIKPVLRALGHTFEIQAALNTPGGTKKLDNIFYHDATRMTVNKNEALDEALLQGKAFVDGDAKWGASELCAQTEHKQEQL